MQRGGGEGWAVSFWTGDIFILGDAGMPGDVSPLGCMSHDTEHDLNLSLLVYCHHVPFPDEHLLLPC